MQLTPEQVRFHAAGHLAAAALLVRDGQGAAARIVLSDIRTYINHAKVSAPDALKQMIEQAVQAPALSLPEIEQMERWFVDPFNTVIEKSGTFT